MTIPARDPTPLMPFPTFARALGLSEHLAKVALERGPFTAPILRIGNRRYLRRVDAEALIAAIRTPNAGATAFRY